MASKYYILEGLPGSGKTTLSRHLEESFENVERIGEVLDGDGREIPKEEHRNRDWEFFVRSEVEKFRSSDAEKLVLDRGFPSTVSHAYAREKEGMSPLHEVITELEKRIDFEGKDITYIYLENTVEKSLERASHAQDDIWGSRKNLEATKEFYDLFFLGRDNVRRVDVSRAGLEKTKRKLEKIVSDQI